MGDEMRATAIEPEQQQIGVRRRIGDARPAQSPLIAHRRRIAGEQQHSGAPIRRGGGKRLAVVAQMIRAIERAASEARRDHRCHAA